jgi:hypothetical protein
MSAKKDDYSLNAEGQIGDKSCLIAIDTGASVTIAMPDFSAELPKRELIRPYVLHMAAGDTIPVMKEALVELAVGWCPLMTWVFFTKITDEIFLGLDVLCTHNASMDLWHDMLQLGDEEVPLWCPGA